MFFPIVPPIATTPLTMSFVDYTLTSSNSNSYTFTGQSIGTADATRYLVIGAAMGAGAPDGSTPAVTVDGAATTVLHRVQSGGTAVGFFGIAKPTGTTADIAVSGGSGWDRCGISVYQVTGPDPASITVTDTASDDTYTGSDLSVSIDMLTEGATFAMVYLEGGAGSGNFTWTNISEDFDASAERAFGGASTSSGNGTTTVTLTSGDTSGSLLVVVSIR